MPQVLPYIYLAVAAVGTGVSVYSQGQAAKTQESFALLNSQAQLRQSQMEADQAVAQSRFQAQQSRNQQTAGDINAEALRDEAARRTRAQQLNLARQQEDAKRLRSMLLNNQSKTGTVAGTGSQLDLLVEAAELQALEINEAAYQGELERVRILREAEATQTGAELAGIQSGLDILGGQAAASAYRARGVQSQIQGLANVSAARGARLNAIGSGLSGFSQLGRQAYVDYQTGVYG